MKKIACLLLLLTSLIPFSPFSHVRANDTDLYILTQQLEQVPPDALILLDLSGSMNWTPAGSSLYIDVAESHHCDNHDYETGYGGPYYSQSGGTHTWKCNGVPYSGTRPRYGDSSCSDSTGFYTSSGTGHETDCSRVAIAKRALFKFLDTDNDDGINPALPDNDIDIHDQEYLKIRMGYMRFYDCGSAETVSSTSYTGGCNTLIWPNPDHSFYHSSYTQVYCNHIVDCYPSDSSSGSISGENATGGTPVAAALQEAKYYLDYTKSDDVNAACRQKFVILLTDGADTFACPGTWNNPRQNGSETNRYQYMGRRETVARARALANAGYYVFVVGFGSNMPYYLQNTLNWAGYYGKTKNTTQTQSITQMYTIPYGQIYPDGITQCRTTTSTQAADGHYYATSNDPGELGISGYAFIAQNSNELDAAISAIRTFIVTLAAESTSYVAPVVPISQFQSTSSANRMYLGMFKPTETTMWKGNIKKFGIASTATSVLSVGDVIDVNDQLVLTSQNTIKSTAQSYWSSSADGGEVEAGGVGEILQARDPNSRSIYSYFGADPHLNHSTNAFSLLNRDPEDVNGKISTITLGVGTTTERDAIINFVHGWDAWDWDLDSNTSEKRDWILGAFIHSRPVVIHYGSYDVIYAGANDGMLHAFKDSNGGDGDGSELWTFIPPDLLPKLKNLNSSPPDLQIFVDGSPKVYVRYNYNADGSINSVDQATLIFGERRGGSYYYALDVTYPEDPRILWSIGPSTPGYGELGQSWSAPILGKIKDGNGTKRVVFIGGGYDENQDSTSPVVPDSHGKAIYVVDIANGNPIWQYSTNMNYCIPSDLMPIDVNGDGLIERLYVGNVGGEIWRFDIGDASNTASWAGEKIFTGSGKIFYPPDVTFENYMQNAIGSGTHSMLFFGTGDREKPNDTGVTNTLYAIKDYDVLPVPLTVLTESNLVDVTTNVLQSSATQAEKAAHLDLLKAGMGWYIRLNRSTGTNPNPGEKCSGPAVVLGGAVYYTTFTPTPVVSETVCEIATGSGNVYIVQYQTGNAVFDLDDNSVLSVTDRSMGVGAGIPSGIIIAIINGTVTGYGGVAGGVFSPELTIKNSIIPSGWRIVF